jgi:glycosyltransferase involved in cell wall biosynthesis
MSTYRRAKLLPRMIAALEAQTLPLDRFEVVIVDNGSHDETEGTLAELVRQSPLRLRPLFIDVNHGPAAARNLGWKAATAATVAFTDDDCVPDPGWLEAGLRLMNADDDLGIVQGRTMPQRDYVTTRWTVYREVKHLSGLWEGCNLFVRRTSLEASGGFDEAIGWYGEDTALGWGVLAAGWRGAFADDAVVTHDLSERGVRWHMKQGFLEGNNIGLATRFPAFHATFWRPWAYRPRNAAFAVGVVGLVLAVWKRPALLLLLPWAWLRRPPLGYHPYFRLLAERASVDGSVFAGMLLGSVKHRRFVL